MSAVDYKKKCLMASRVPVNKRTLKWLNSRNMR